MEILMLLIGFIWRICKLVQYGENNALVKVDQGLKVRPIEVFPSSFGLSPFAILHES
jgi:hypothetical protein